jgi:hypothetical protein
MGLVEDHTMTRGKSISTRPKSLSENPKSKKRPPSARSPAQINHEMVARFRKWLTAQNYLESTVQKYCAFATSWRGR